MLLLSRYGVAVQDFASSWRSGLAFLATIKAIDSSLVDMKQALEKSPRENLEDAFTIAQDHLGIPRLLEPEGNFLMFAVCRLTWRRQVETRVNGKECACVQGKSELGKYGCM